MVDDHGGWHPPACSFPDTGYLAGMQDEGLLLRKDAFVEIRLHPEKSMIVLRWTGFAPSPDFRSILEMAQLNVRRHRIRRWLADLRQMNAILRQDEQWSIGDWFPRLASAGLERMAIVASADYFNQTSVDRIVGAAALEMPFPVTYHPDPVAAEQWLMEG